MRAKTTTMDELIFFLEGKKNQALKESNLLVADNRADEGILLKIRANIFEIFEGLIKGGHDFEGLLVKIPQTWETSLEQALVRDDHIKIAQEKIKLDAIAEIKAFLTEEESRE